MPEDAHTTGSGLLASVERGAAPYAAGAGIGAAIGAPIGGVGAIPGAAAGVGAVALTDLASSVYNPIAKATGLPTMLGPTEAVNKVMDWMGIPRPKTGVERIAQSTAQGASGGLSTALAAKQLSTMLSNPTTVRTLEALAKSPGLQTLAGGTGGASGQTAAEAGADPTVQFLATLGGGAVPFAAKSIPEMISAPASAAAAEAHKAGYVLPPGAASDTPSLASKVGSAISGKVKTYQAASAINQGTTNELAVKALGLPEGTPLNDQTFNQIRQTAGQAYMAVGSAIPEVKLDPQFSTDIQSLGSRTSQAAQHFPGIMRNAGIEDLVDNLKSVANFPPDAGLEAVRELRFQATGNLKAIGDPSKHALGLAQRQAANAVDDLIERNITASGQTDVVQNYRQARALIAKSYDVQTATNDATGDVSARGIARLAAKGRPLTGELKTIAKTADAFPKAMQNVSSLGGTEDWSVLDFAGAAGSAMAGKPEGVLAFLSRGPVRKMLLSPAFQRAMMNPKTAAHLPAVAAMAPALPNLGPSQPADGADQGNQ